ncbi:hypothetical protein Tco_1331522, partial [Tanacetum coccineum]
ATRQTCLGAEVRMRTEHILREKKMLEARSSETAALEGQVAALESAAAIKDPELASSNAQITKLTQDFSNFLLSYDELSVKAATFESEKDKLTDQVSMLETTCSGLRDQVSGYELFKEQYEAVQGEQVKILSDKVVELDSDLIGMALYLNEEFNPRFLTTIAGWRWIFGRGLRLVVIKCLQSLKYLAALGGAVGRAIDKGMQDGLAVGIDHGKAERGLVDVAAYNPSAEANYVSVMNALRLVAEASKTSQLQPSYEQLMLPIQWTKDNVVIRETSLSFSLDVVHSRVQRIKGDAASHHLSLSDAMVPLIKPLSARNLVGEASTSGVLAAVASTTALSTTLLRLTPFLLCQCQLMMQNRMLKFLLPPRLYLKRKN